MIHVMPMSAADLPEVLAIEQSAFPTPWSEAAFRTELTGNRFSRLLVARREHPGAVAGYICFWLVHEELRIQNVAVEPSCRRRGVATALLQAALDAGRAAGACDATLEVRPSNAAALALYRRLGFVRAGRRRGYYGDSGEDALLLSRSLPRQDG